MLEAHRVGRAYRTAGRFPLAIWDRTTLRDGEVSVAFKAVDGSIDQAAGIVWHYADSNNYYIVRADALENNVVLYKVRTECASPLPEKASHRAFVESNT